MPVELIRNIATTLQPTDHPYRSGAWSPIAEEVNASDMETVGEIPRDIDGVYVRNTENPVHEPIGRYHPFDGDGMIHIMTFRDGKATYRNRLVDTKGLRAEMEAGHALWAGLMESPERSLRPGWGAHGSLKDTSSTDVVVHSGEILSTFYQCGDVYRLDPFTLEQSGVEGWTPLEGVSAHTKVDEHNGELLFFNYSKFAPYMHYGVVSPEKRVVHYTPVPLPGPRLPHDMAFTENYAILNDCPMFWDPELLKLGKHVVRFHRDIPTRFAVIPRRGDASQIRWFEADPTYILHFANAYEDGAEIVIDGYFQENPEPEPRADAPAGYAKMMAFLDREPRRPKLHRWRLNLTTGATREERIDDRILEFGIINNQYGGRPHRFVYSAISKPGWFLFTGIVKHDMETRESWTATFGEDCYISEAAFAPRIGATSEDDGYLITFTTDMKADRSECVILDARKIDGEPVCRIRLPHRISAGTHATWGQGDAIRAAQLR